MITLRRIAAAWLLLCTTAPGTVLAHPPADETIIAASWRSLQQRDDMLELSRPRLVLHLDNHSDEAVVIHPRLRMITDGTVHTLRMRKVRLGARAERAIRVKLPTRHIKRAHLRFSGKLTLSLDVTTRAHRKRHRGHKHRDQRRQRPFRGTNVETVNISLPTLYFHRQGRKLLVYREDVLRERYAAGNFRNTPLRVPEALRGLRDELALMRLDRLTPVLGSIQLAPSFPGIDDAGGFLPPGSKKICFGLDGSAFDDAGQHPNNINSPPAEDFGLVGDFVPAARAWVTVGQAGNPMFTGHLDADGCTDYFIANNSDEMSVAFFPLYRRDPVDVRGFVSDLNLGPQWPDSMPWFLSFFEPGNSTLTEVLLDPEEYVNTIYVAAANSMERVRGGVNDVLYEFRLREEGDNSSTNVFYAIEGHPQVRIKYSAAARQKFTISHEYGHAMHIAKMAPPLTVNDLDYSVTNAEAEQHTLTSKEWQLTAAFEGFGHFVSTAVWNDAVPDDDALFRSGNSTILVDDFDRLFENNFDVALFPDQGVESDWAQFFWNYHTDDFVSGGGDPVLAPTVGAILDMWLASQPWPVQQGFFEDYRDGVEIILGTFGPGNPVEDGLERFDEIADDAGIVH